MAVDQKKCDPNPGEGHGSNSPLSIFLIDNS